MEIIDQRLRALGIEDAVVEVNDNEVKVDLGEDVEVEDAAGVIGRQAELKFRPVLLAVPADAASDVALTARGDDEPEKTVVLAAPSDGERYQLGPAAATGSIIENAEAQLGPDDRWLVALTLTADGIEQFNAIASVCSPPGATCPSGQLAIVLDSEVLSAPAIQSSSFSATTSSSRASSPRTRPRARGRLGLRVAPGRAHPDAIVIDPSPTNATSGRLL